MDVSGAGPLTRTESHQRFLDRWWVAWVIAAFCAIPLLWPTTPPLVDLPGHIGRFRVQLDLNSAPSLKEYFDFHWHLIGNLGSDLLIIPLEPIFGLEFGVKLIVLSVPILSAVGIFWVAREVHGHIPPTTLFALPFIYGYPFNFGFLNFSLSMALALLAFGCWLHLSQYRRLRAVIFVPISCVVWLAHAFGWGVLGLLTWSSEFVKLRDDGQGWTKAASQAAINSLPLCIPLALMALWRGGQVGGETGGYFNLGLKVFSLAAAARDRWVVWDTMSVAVAVVLVGSAVFDKHLELSRRLAIPAGVLAITFVVLPYKVFGSAYADMRLGPFMLIISILAIRFRSSASDTINFRICELGAVFFMARILGNTMSFVIADANFRTELEALKYIPNDARVLSLVGDSCGSVWEMPRFSHLGSFVITRKLGFSNDQWQLPGAQLLSVKYDEARPYSADPSELTYSKECRLKILRALPAGKHLIVRTTDQALERFPRNAFDFVWLIGPAGYTPRPRPDLQFVWRGADASLYRVVQTRNTAGAQD